ncbi:carbamate kinase [Marinitenerispora sediminis]|uniref:Carbamate kinase n=1 Tax=Marinitenerispora sediminis TaxID=1931232 RepID=A0A368T603_9ACTN|nr:carbamate kinase [Marinitenerispora sediminis]RCV53304.1 carbamate kinase [Marinitenerispora sediminis]RCV58520.1 carbamate kinase [Marinitenerispora sediminis]RCV58863.1 carbamate kinase [Marinitenerispora sediminis]
MPETRRVLVALGGNAMAAPDGSARPEDQRAAIETAMEHVADLVAGGTEVVLTHGNGPQVGNLLVKNELAAHVVPPVPLDWCGAQTQGTIGFTMAGALEAALRRRGVARPVAAVVTRTLVDPGDPAFAAPSKPVGRYLDADQAARFIALGQNWVDQGERGWRRVVPSPQPREILDAAAIGTLVAAGVTTIAAGGGGIPVVRDAAGALRGVEAVLDKDRTSVLLARVVRADTLLIATDVPNAVVGFGTPEARPLGRVDAAELGAYHAAGHFGRGSMGPKVEAALRFVAGGGERAVITALDRMAAGLAGEAGTIVARSGPAMR